MKRSIVALGSAVFLIACSTQKTTTSYTAITAQPQSNPEKKSETSYTLVEQAADKTYGYTKKNPVKVGGGPANERNYLNALSGPNGEPITYYRSGSCCAFKTPNGLIDNTGFLDIYIVSWEGSKDSVTLYLNMYDKDDLKIPVGFTAKK